MAEGVFKRGNVWYALVEFPRKPNGKRDQRQIPCPRMNQKQAIRHRAELIARIHDQDFVDPSKLTVAEYLDQWVERIRPNVSPTTYQSYSSCLRNHLIPGLGRLRLQALRPLHVRALYDDLVKTLSAKTVRNVHGVLCSALSQAVKLQLVRANAAQNMDLPKERKSDMEIADAGSLRRLLHALQGTPYWLPTLIIISTGLRRGEVLGLRWEDFREPIADEDYGLLIVRRSIVQVPGRVIVKDTKSGRARAVAIPLALVEILHELRNGSEGWICADEKGDHITPGEIGTIMTRVCRREGISIRLHGLRHTYATYIGEQGVSLPIVTQILGHANSRITEERYFHLRPRAQGPAAQVADGLLREIIPESALQTAISRDKLGLRETG